MAPGETCEIVRSLPHGPVTAGLGTVRRLGVDARLAARNSRRRALVLAMLVARVMAPPSKGAPARSLDMDTAWTSLGPPRGVEAADAHDLEAAMEWLLPRQARMEAALARRHLEEGTLALYALPATYGAGQPGPRAPLGHARDGKQGQVQMVCGLVGNAAGCPGAVEVCAGNPGAPTTLAVQRQTLRHRFPLRRVVLVGDRELLTDARIRAALQPVPGREWVTALRGPALQTLVSAGRLALACCETTAMVARTAPAYPEERWIACRNPGLATERARKREALLHATERELDKLVHAPPRGQRRLTGQAHIAWRVGQGRHRFKMGKHFHSESTNETGRYARDTSRLAAEAALDGLSVLRTSAPQETLDTVRPVRASKSLATGERALRRLQTGDLPVRPMGHRRAEWVRAHVLRCMRAYYVAWHMRRGLAPLWFDDDDNAAGEARRAASVAPAQRAPTAQRKAHTQRTEDGWPVQSFQTLLQD